MIGENFSKIQNNLKTRKWKEQSKAVLNLQNHSSIMSHGSSNSQSSGNISIDEGNSSDHQIDLCRVSEPQNDNLIT